MGKEKEKEKEKTNPELAAKAAPEAKAKAPAKAKVRSVRKGFLMLAARGREERELGSSMLWRAGAIWTFVSVFLGACAAVAVIARAAVQAAAGGGSYGFWFLRLAAVGMGFGFCGVTGLALVGLGDIARGVERLSDRLAPADDPAGRDDPPDLMD